MAKSLLELESRNEACAIHGAYLSRHLFGRIWTKCQRCEDDDTQAERERERQVRIQQRLDLSGLQGRWLDASFSNFMATTPEQRVVLAACRAYTAEFASATGGLWLIGPPGAGKTHLGAAMVNDLIHVQNTAAIMLSGRAIVRRLRATWNRESGLTEQDVLDQIASMPLLVLDEVGVGSGTEVEHAQIFDVVDARYELGRPTVVLSNLTPEQIKVAIGHRAYDRLREGARVHTCNWPSRRGAA